MRVAALINHNHISILNYFLLQLDLTLQHSNYVEFISDYVEFICSLI